MENFRLTVFRAVAKHSSFSRAAQELLLTQPAVTQQIKALEDQLGHPLSGREAGELSLGASQTVAQYLLPHVIVAFLQTHPQVRITARSGNSDQILAALLTGEINLALLEGPEQRTDVHIEPFMKDHMVLVVPSNHEWAGRRITLAQLHTQPLLVREFGSGSRRIVERALADAGCKLKGLNIRMELDSTEGLLHAVEAGLGVTFVSRWAVRNQLALGTLKVARVEGLKLSRSFSIAYPAGPAPSGNVGVFRTYLLGYAASAASGRTKSL